MARNYEQETPESNIAYYAEVSTRLTALTERWNDFYRHAYNHSPEDIEAFKEDLINEYLAIEAEHQAYLRSFTAYSEEKWRKLKASFDTLPEDQ